MTTEWSLSILALAALALAAAGVPALLAWRRMARETEHLALLLREELPPLLRELRATTQHVDHLTDQVEAGLDRMRRLTGFVAGAGGSALGQQAGRLPVWGAFLWRTLIMGAGLRAAAAAVRRWRAPAGRPEEVRNGQ